MTNAAIIAGLHDAFRPLVVEGIARARSNGVVVDLDSGRRDPAEQHRLFLIFQAGGPRAAPPGQSAHEYGLAVDIAVVEGASRLYSGRSFSIAVEAFTKAGCQFLSPLYDDPGHAQHPQWRELARVEGYDGNPHMPPLPGPTPVPPPGIPDRGSQDSRQTPPVATPGARRKC